ncbi:hypothetical protein ACHAPG_010495 [Botrytis cinerea]
MPEPAGQNRLRCPCLSSADLQRMREMVAVWYRLKSLWKASELYDEQAVCVGIGKMDGRGEGREEWKLDGEYGGKGLKGLCQLIMFQCWVETLRENFALPDTAIAFYFPRGLSRVEELFMQGLGYRNSIVRYYHELKSVVTPDTFLFITSKHVKFWHKGLLGLVVPGLMVSAPLQVIGYWENYGRGTQRVFRRFLNRAKSRKLGPLVDITSLTSTELTDLRWKPGSRESAELRMSEISMNYEFYWRPDPDPESIKGDGKEKEKPMYGWYTSMAWHKLPGPTGIPGDIYEMGDVEEKLHTKNISWWGRAAMKSPITWLVYLDIVLRWLKGFLANTFWPDNLGGKEGSLGRIEAVWDSREEEDGEVWYLVERKTKTGTDWGYWLSEDLGPGAWGKVNDFHYACPGRKRGDVQIGWCEYGEVIIEEFWDSYFNKSKEEKRS